jgi:hypothetical protein
MASRGSSIHPVNGKSPDDYDPHIGRHVLEVGFVLAIAAIAVIWIATAYLE